MLGVVAARNRVNVVELVPVEIPIADETLRKLFVVLADRGQWGTKRRQVSRHPRRLSFFVKDQPVGMLLDDIGDDVFVVLIFELSILYCQWQPPELDLYALLVKISDHLLDEVSAESILAWLPVAVILKPAIVEGGPVNAEFLQLGDGVAHLFWRSVGLLTPAAPANGVVFLIGFRARQTFTLHGLRPGTQGFVIITVKKRQERSRRGEAFACLERGGSWNLNGRVDFSICRCLHRNGEGQRQRFQMPDRQAHVACPEGYDRHSSAYTPQVIVSFHRGAEGIVLRKLCRDGQNIIFAPADARSEKCPHFVRFRVAVRQRGVQRVILQRHFVQDDVFLAGILVGSR